MAVATPPAELPKVICGKDERRAARSAPGAKRTNIRNRSVEAGADAGPTPAGA